MGKKILSAVLIVASFFFGSPDLAKAGEASRPVRILMKDNSVINGDLLGRNEGVLSILNEDGKFQDIAVFKIKKVFDTDGKTVTLSDQNNSVKEEASQDKEDRPAPRRNKRVARHSNGMKTAGVIMTFSGLGVGLVGAILWVSGYSMMEAAYTTEYDYYYDYYGNYTYDSYSADDYSSYSTGAYYVTYGEILAGIGLAVGITGVILWANGAARARQEQTSLMHLEDGQVAWALPEVQMQPRMGARMTLLSAKF